jgi:uncharacterized protein (TIGR00725 family)
LLPGASRAEAAVEATVVLPTGLGEARNVLLVRAADVVVAVGGSWGTLSEIAFGRRSGRPVVALGGWRVHDAAGEELQLRRAASPAEAAQLVLALLGEASGTMEP